MALVPRQCSHQCFSWGISHRKYAANAYATEFCLIQSDTASPKGVWLKKCEFRLRLINRTSTKPSLWCRLMYALIAPSKSIAAVAAAADMQAKQWSLQGCRRAAAEYKSHVTCWIVY